MSSKLLQYLLIMPFMLFSEIHWGHMLLQRIVALKWPRWNLRDARQEAQERTDCHDGQ